MGEGRENGPKTVRIESDPFVIEREAGSGGMGTVFRARDRKTSAPLAVKVLRERAGDLTRFALEANVLAKLKHPAIVAYAHHGLTSDGSPYLAMEWLEGESLEKRLSRSVLTVFETLRIARTIADALSVAHEANVVHRDLKPSNVFLVTPGEEVKLLDFGVAKCLATEGLTHTGQTLGTPGYMSPEQARGAAVDARADLFSLGCVIFRCLGGRRPFGGTDIMSYATKLALEPAPKLREVAPQSPLELEALVDRLLEKRPEDRPPSAAAVRDALARIANDIEAVPSTLTEAEVAVATKPSPEAPSGPDATMLSPAPVVETKKTLAHDPERRSRMPLFIGAAAIAAVGAAFWLGQKNGAIEPPKTTAMTPPSAIVSAAPLPKDDALIPSADRVTLDRACREWGGIIARSQKAEGGFAGEAHRDAVGWDTAQELFALAESERACKVVGPAPLVAGARALEKMRTEDGWRGAVRAGQVDDKQGQSPANAWAALALDRVKDVPEPHDATIDALAIRARTDLLKMRNADGGFRYKAQTAGKSMIYSSMLGTWALMDTRSPAPVLDEPSLAALRREVLDRTEASLQAGATEQIAFILARAHRKGAGGQGSDAAIQSVAKTIVEHCRIQGDACKRPMSEVGRIELSEGGGKLVTLFHPWATVGAYELLRDATMPIDDGTRRSLRVVLAWGLQEMKRLVEPLAAAPEYKVAEYLLAVALLIDDRP